MKSVLPINLADAIHPALVIPRDPEPSVLLTQPQPPLGTLCKSSLPLLILWTFLKFQKLHRSGGCPKLALKIF